MSQKHHQRTRAQKLARRAGPSPIGAPTVMVFSNRAKAALYIQRQRFTAKTLRAMRSVYTPEGLRGLAVIANGLY